MSLIHTLRIVIPNENLDRSLRWLREHSDPDLGSDMFVIQGTPIRIAGADFTGKKKNHDTYDLTEYRNAEGDLERVFECFSSLNFSTSLLFDVDLDLIELFQPRELQYRKNRLNLGLNEHEYLDLFVERVKDSLSTNGKLRIGIFETSLIPLPLSDCYALEFTAVISEMSYAMERSLSMKRWFAELSEVSQSKITLLLFESGEAWISYYKGQAVDIRIGDELDEFQVGLMKDLFDDYLELR